MNLKKILVIFPAILCSPAVFAANILDSIYGIGAGSFEIPGYTGPLYLTLANGSNYIRGWTVNTSNIDLVDYQVWTPSNGQNSIDMNGTPGGPGGIETMITTTIGATYRVTFDIAGFTSPDNLTNPKTMETTAAGVTTQFSLTTTDSFSQPFALPLAVTWHTRHLIVQHRFIRIHGLDGRIRDVAGQCLNRSRARAIHHGDHRSRHGGFRSPPPPECLKSGRKVERGDRKHSTYEKSMAISLCPGFFHGTRRGTGPCRHRHMGRRRI
jgi:hypothetical protein